MNSCNLGSLISYEREIDAIVNQALEEFHVPGAAVVVVFDCASIRKVRSFVEIRNLL